MSTPARRHDAGETPARTAGSCHVLQLCFQPVRMQCAPIPLNVTADPEQKDKEQVFINPEIINATCQPRMKRDA